MTQNKANYLDWAYRARAKMRKRVKYSTQLDGVSSRFLTQDGDFDADTFENTLHQTLKLEDGYKWAFLVHENAELHLIVYRQNGIEIELLQETLDDKRNSNFEYGRKALESHFVRDAVCGTVVANYDYATQKKE